MHGFILKEKLISERSDVAGQIVLGFVLKRGILSFLNFGNFEAQITKNFFLAGCLSGHIEGGEIKGNTIS